MTSPVSAMGKCGNITISSGTIIATGGRFASGIGLASGHGACGNITIESGITSVSATKGVDNSNGDFIGRGNYGSYFALDFTITIDGVVNPTPATSETLFPNLDSVVDGGTWTLTHK